MQESKRASGLIGGAHSGVVESHSSLPDGGEEFLKMDETIPKGTKRQSRWVGVFILVLTLIAA
ncbi:MAG: hypothetical protein NZ959_03220, partial [Armatimonadetes bacterium]|nr:hypothetical protein [Armatimonadota bacterium]